MIAQRRIRFIFISLVFVSLWLTATGKVHHYRQNLPPDYARAEALMVQPALLRIISGEFKGVVADYLHLKMAIFLGGDEESTPQDLETLYVMAKQALTLDPYFAQSAYFLQGYLVWKPGMAQKAIELLDIQARHRDWDYEPNWFIGFNYLHFFQDRQKAYQFLTKAAAIEGAPTLVGALAARLAQDQGGTVVAITMLKAMIDGSEDEAFKEVLTFRLESYLGIYQIEEALKTYHQRTGRWPDTLQRLVDDALLPSVPTRPDGKPFFYNSETGVVLFDDSEVFRTQ